MLNCVNSTNSNFTGYVAGAGLMMNQVRENLVLNYIRDEYPGGVSYTIDQIMARLPSEFRDDDIDEAIGELVEDDLKADEKMF